MPRVNRKIRAKVQNRITRAQILELLIGPNGASVFETPEQSRALWRDVQSQISPEFAAQWHCAHGSERRPFAEIAEQYARDVISGKISACKWTRLACLRHIEDLDRAAGGEWEHRFDVARAERACRFIELLPHVKGKWAAKSERIVLQPWQIFIVCVLFGWVSRATGYRRFTLAVIIVPRKNGKSVIAAGIALYLFAADGEFGAEVYSGATTEKQAWEVFGPARLMMERSSELSRILGLRTPPAAKQLAMPENGSRFEPVIGKPGDGASPHGGIVDEYHEHDSDALFDTLRTGMGARTQPLQLVISTAGTKTAGPCRLLQTDCEKILARQAEREEVFAIIYTIDDPKAWASMESIEMANPNLGVSVSREYLLTELRAALANPRKQSIFQTKYLDVWAGAMSNYFDVGSWRALGDSRLTMDALIGHPCVVSVDLSTKRDFTVRVAEFKKQVQGKDHYFVFAQFYLPAAQMALPENGHYKEWEKHIRICAGATVDFEEIMKDTIAVVKATRAREFAYDPWNAAQFAQGVQKETRAQIVEIPQNVKTLSAPMKDLDTVIVEKRIHHDDNPVLAWMLGNVMAREDGNENVFPRKEENRGENKIDGAVATIMTHSRLMVAAPKKSVYSTRGVLMVDAMPMHA
jgi:phage terminase large subunit-like protein